MSAYKPRILAVGVNLHLIRARYTEGEFADWWWVPNLSRGDWLDSAVDLIDQALKEKYLTNKGAKRGRH